eukprot:scaffold549_cov385-Prasinococcus_capsulatus_cf.AAC.3
MSASVPGVQVAKALGAAAHTWAESCPARCHPCGPGQALQQPGSPKRGGPVGPVRGHTGPLYARVSEPVRTSTGEALLAPHATSSRFCVSVA